jgi:hypothetical protein
MQNYLTALVAFFSTFSASLSDFCLSFSAFFVPALSSYNAHNRTVSD